MLDSLDHELRIDCSVHEIFLNRHTQLSVLFIPGSSIRFKPISFEVMFLSVYDSK